MYCDWDAHDFEDERVQAEELTVVHVEHLLHADPSIQALADLPVDMGAERTHADASWTRFEDTDT